MKFEQPQTLAEAVTILKECADMMILAGGTDIVVQRRAGKRDISPLLDITRIPQLREIRLEGNTLFVGAAATCAALQRSELLQACSPLLCAAAAAVGAPQIRSRATIGGNVANASPAADLIPALVAVDAQAVVHSFAGVRRVSVAELVVAPSRIALEAGEVISGFEWEAFSPESRWSFEKVGRRNALAISRLNGACTFTWENGRIWRVRLCIGAATNRPQRLLAAESVLHGQIPTDALFQQAGELVKDEILEQTGLRESSRYKLPVSVEFTARLLRNALGGA